jgi:predicted dehydrogenase
VKRKSPEAEMGSRPNKPADRPYRVGIVGAGGIASIHAEVLKHRLRDADLVAVCDISPEALNRFGDGFDVHNRYLDLGQMLDREVLDVMIVCNWGVDHAATVIQIVGSERVKAVLCEKPLAMDAGEAKKMVAAAEAHGVLLAEAFKFRHHPMHLKAKALVDSGAIGEVKSIRSTLVSRRGGSEPSRRTPESDWRFSKAKGGGSINDLGCYCLAQARYIYGAEPVRLFAQPQMGIEVDDGAAVLLVFPDCRTAQFTVGFNAWPSQYVEISGSAGSLRMAKPWNNSDEATILDYQNPVAATSIDFEPLLQYTCQLQHLFECLDTGRPYRISPKESIKQMRVIDAIVRSMTTGQAVDL